MEMENVKRFFEDFGINVVMLLAGAFGGYVKQSMKKDLNFLERFSIIIVGSVVANYLGPIVGHWLNVSDEVKYGFAFLLGIIGIEAATLLALQVKKMLRNLLVKKPNDK